TGHRATTTQITANNPPTPKLAPQVPTTAGDPEPQTQDTARLNRLPSPEWSTALPHDRSQVTECYFQGGSTPLQDTRSSMGEIRNRPVGHQHSPWQDTDRMDKSPEPPPDQTTLLLRTKHVTHG